MAALLGSTSINMLGGTTSSMLGNAYQSNALTAPPSGPVSAPSPGATDPVAGCGCSGSGFNPKWLLGGAAVVGALMLLRK